MKGNMKKTKTVVRITFVGDKKSGLLYLPYVVHIIVYDATPVHGKSRKYFSVELLKAQYLHIHSKTKNVKVMFLYFR